MKKIVTSLILVMFAVALFSLESAADEGDVGTTSANFLKIGIGARAVAMGEAFTALVDDGSSLYWNPAGLAKIKNKQFFTTYNMWFQNISQGYLSYILPFGKNRAGFALNYVDMGKIQGYNKLGYPTYQFGASNLLFQIAYAKKVAMDFSLGISVGYLSDTIDNNQQTAFHANIGLMKSTSHLDVALVTQNLGSSLKEDPLPLTHKVGLAVKISSIILSCDVAFPNDNNVYLCVGMELPLSHTFTLRAGYRSNKDIGSGISAGMGFKLDKVALDYAYAPYGELGDTHRFSLGISF